MPDVPVEPALVTVDPIELCAALLRADATSWACLDRRSGEVHRSVAECDPEEDDRRFDDRARFLVIPALDASAVIAFWEGAGVAEAPAAGLYAPLAARVGDARARLLGSVSALARAWLEARGVVARLRSRD